MLRTAGYYLSLNSESLRLWQLSARKGAVLSAEFSNDDNGRAALKEHLSKTPGARYFLLIDTSDEIFAVERIPALSRWSRDRKTIIARLLHKHTPDSLLKRAVPQGTVKADSAMERDKERLFIHAINPSAWLDSWLSLIGHAQARIAGVYSFSSIASRLAGYCRFERGILLTSDRNTLRQTVIDDGMLCFSRLVNIPDPCLVQDMESIDAYAAMLHDETYRLQSFLHNNPLLRNPLSSLSSSGSLPVLVLGDERTGQAIAGRNLPWQFERIDRLDLGFGLCREQAAFIGMESAYVECFAGAKGLPSLHGEVRDDSYSRPLTFSDGVHRWRQWILAGCVSGLAMSGIFYYHGQQEIEKSRQALAVAQQNENEAAALADHVALSPPAGTIEIPVKALYELAVLHTTLTLPEEGAYRFPQAIYVALSRVIEQNPAVELNRIDWQRAEELHLTLEGWIKPSLSMHTSPTLPMPASRSRVASDGKRCFEQFLAALQNRLNIPKSSSVRIKIERRPFTFTPSRHENDSPIALAAPATPVADVETEAVDPSSQFSLEIFMTKPRQSAEEIRAVNSTLPTLITTSNNN